MIVLLAALSASAHEFRPIVLDLRQQGDVTWEATWTVPANAGGAPTPVIAGCDGEFAPPRWTVTCPDGLADVGASEVPAGASGVVVTARWADGREQVRVLDRSTPSAPIGDTPATGFAEHVALGARHILSGLDHVLFVALLTLRVRGGTSVRTAWRPLVATVSAFTVGHSLTLAAAALGALNVAQAPVEVLIAASIAVLAREVVLADGERGGPALAAAAGFGLFHGLGFVGALRSVGLPPDHVAGALLGFNVGVELGQLGIVLAVYLLMSPVSPADSRVGGEPRPRAASSKLASEPENRRSTGAIVAVAWLAGVAGAMLTLQRALALVGAW